MSEKTKAEKAEKTRDVIVVVRGVPENTPEDRIAFLVGQAMGHRCQSVELRSRGAKESS